MSKTYGQKLCRKLRGRNIRNKYLKTLDKTERWGKIMDRKVTQVLLSMLCF